MHSKPFKVRVLSKWEALYLGLEDVTYTYIPTKQNQFALNVLVLVGANQLMEVALYDVLRAKGCAAKALEYQTYSDMLTKTLPSTLGKPIDTESQPFASTEKLRKRRNASGHKTAAPVTYAMARSALFSAVRGSLEVYAQAGLDFPDPLDTPLTEEPWFTDVEIPTP